MKYQELNSTNPFNYFPTGDSAKFTLPESRADKFRRLWKKHYGTSKRGKKTDSSQMVGDVPISCEPENNDRMISVGGLVGESTTSRYLHLATIARGIWDRDLLEKKNPRKSKRSAKRPAEQPNDPRSKKIRDLRNRDDLWSGLE